MQLKQMVVSACLKHKQLLIFCRLTQCCSCHLFALNQALRQVTRIIKINRTWIYWRCFVFCAVGVGLGIVKRVDLKNCKLFSSRYQGQGHFGNDLGCVYTRHLYLNFDDPRHLVLILGYLWFWTSFFCMTLIHQSQGHGGNDCMCGHQTSVP